jgi:hypothetical protein
MLWQPRTTLQGHFSRKGFRGLGQCIKRGVEAVLARRLGSWLASAATNPITFEVVAPASKTALSGWARAKHQPLEQHQLA